MHNFSPRPRRRLKPWSKWIPNKGAHDFKTYPTGARDKLLGLLTVMAATTESAYVGPRANGGGARFGGVPCLAPAVFDTVGGVLFVPVRYASPHNPELGFPPGWGRQLAAVRGTTDGFRYCTLAYPSMKKIKKSAAHLRLQQVYSLEEWYGKI